MPSEFTYAGGDYGSVLYGTSAQPDLVKGHIIQPEVNCKIDGTIRTYMGKAYGFEQGTGRNLGYMRSIEFRYEPEYEPVDAPTFSQSNLVEMVGEECLVSVEILEWDWRVLRSLLFNFDTLEDNNLFIASVGHDYEVGTSALHPLVIEFVTCSIGEVGSLDARVRGGFMTFYKAMLTNGLAIQDFNPKTNASINLEFRILPDLTKDFRNRLGTLALY